MAERPAISEIERLDTGQRTFQSGGAVVEVKQRSGWITVKHRGGQVLMSLDEVEDVVAVIRAARDYAK